jgi:hypothetical protein
MQIKRGLTKWLKELHNWNTTLLRHPELLGNKSLYDSDIQ